MRKFVYKTETVKVSRTYGGKIVEATIYEIKRNDLILIGKTTWNTASYRGSDSEVNEYLLDNNVIPKIWSKGELNSYYEVHKCRGGYYTPYYEYRIDTSKYEIKKI